MEDGAGAHDRRRLRQPAGPDPGAAAGELRTGARCCCAPTWTPCRCRRRSSRCSRGDLGERQRGDPGRRQQGRRRGAAGAGAPRPPTRRAGRRRAAVHRRRGDRRWPARRRSTPRSCAATWATSSTTPRRSARSSSTRRATSASRRPSAAPPRTPASARSRGAARSSPPRRAIARCDTACWRGRATVNVGTIAGGTAINVVPEHAGFVAEVRGIDDRHGEALVAELVDRIHEAANRPDCDCDVDVSVQRTFAGYRLAPSAPALRAAEAALRGRGYEPVRISSGGGSDANTLIAQGPADGQPGQRHRAQPRAWRACRARWPSRRCSRSPWPCWTRSRRSRPTRPCSVQRRC